MRDDLTRLRNSDFIILGMLSHTPQTRYALRMSLNLRPEAVQKGLNRLEERRLICASVERAHWVYAITPLGQSALDGWVRSPFTNSEVLRHRDILMTKFLFAEGRLSRQELLDWLAEYEAQLEITDRLYNLWQNTDDGILSLHQRLLMDASHMEIEMQRSWIQKARERMSLPTVSPVLEATSGK